MGSQVISFMVNQVVTHIANELKISPRYVGKICGQNKIVLGIPCHRVIRSDGSLGGFSGIGGVNLKRKLLNLEKNWK